MNAISEFQAQVQRIDECVQDLFFVRLTADMPYMVMRAVPLKLLSSLPPLERFPARQIALFIAIISLARRFIGGIRRKFIPRTSLRMA